jgi:phospholipid/cholesterol/gamma-HCH transport system ATP-binding protein
MTQNAVEIRQLDFSYGDLEIFRKISLDIPRGKVVAILGGSGSGKSTLLKLIGGQLAPSSGGVFVEGQEVHKLGADELYKLRLGMGMMFQSSGLFSDVSVYENVAFPIRENFDLDEEVVRRMVLMKLNAVGLRGARDVMPADLSGGMARRVALARAVVLDPTLVMYDEPFAGLDPIALAVIARLIRTLNDSLGSTSIIVTHDVIESLQLVDYLYFISNGVIVGEGTPDEIRKSTLPYVKQFVHGETDGPVPFHYPAPAYAKDVGLAGGARA